MNDSNRQPLPTSYPSGPPFGSASTVDSWITTGPTAGQPLPAYASLTNHNEFDRYPNHNGPNGAPFMHHSYIQQQPQQPQQQPYLNNKYGSDYNQGQLNSNLYNNYANNYVSKQNANSDGGTDSHMEVCSEGNTSTEGLTARLLDKNSDGTPVPPSPSSQDSGSNGGVGYRPWEAPGADGQPLAQDPSNAQQLATHQTHQTHPNRPSSAQSDKAHPPHQPHPHRTTPDTARRPGRSPSAQQFGDSHAMSPMDRLTNHTNDKYQTLTPVPPLPPISVAYNPNMYGQHNNGPVVYANPMGGHSAPYMQMTFTGPDGKALNRGIEPDSSTPDVRIHSGGLENSFQVPSVSSTTPRPVIGGIPQPSPAQTPPHPQTAQQVVSIHPSPQTVTVTEWEASQVPNNNNMSAQTPNDGEKVTKKKRKRCGECPGCLKKDNCGECGPCKSVRSHQICKMRKCDQLKTKKEKVREAAQMAAAAAASGIPLGKELTGLDGATRNMNGTNISTPFTNLGPNDSPGVGPTPRGQYSELSGPKHSANINQVYDSSTAQTFTNVNVNYHMNSQQIGPYNGHGLVSDVNRSHHSPEESAVNSDNAHLNRHQMMNNRLKSLIQSRQTQKEMNNGQNHNSFGSGPPPLAPPPPQQQQQQQFAGQTFIVVQQQSNANTSLSPHYGNSMPATGGQDSAQSFANAVNWPQTESHQEYDHKNMNGSIGDKLGVSQGRRTPYNSIDLPNGSIYHSFNDSQTNSNSINNSNNISNNNQNNNTNNNNNNSKSNSKSSNTSNTSTSFTPTTTYSTNQSQSFVSPPNQDYSGRQSQRPSSRSSPARAVISSSPGNSGNKSLDNQTMVTISANGVNSSQPHLNNEQNLENEPFLVNTTTTMHHLSDLTTSMNTSTGIINSYNLSPHSQSSAYYPSSLYMPSLGVLGPSSPTVIMPVTDAVSGKKSSEELLTSVGHSISGIDCGRIIDPLDTSSLNLMDVSSMTSFIKSDLNCDLTSETNINSFTSLSGMTGTTTTVLPPVSTFLFRDQWWDRNLDRLKSNTKDSNDCECYAPDEREYSRTSSPSTLTTLPASLSN